MHFGDQLIVKTVVALKKFRREHRLHRMVIESWKRLLGTRVLMILCKDTCWQAHKLIVWLSTLWIVNLALLARNNHGIDRGACFWLKILLVQSLVLEQSQFTCVATFLNSLDFFAQRLVYLRQKRDIYRGQCRLARLGGWLFRTDCVYLQKIRELWIASGVEFVTGLDCGEHSAVLRFRFFPFSDCTEVIEKPLRLLLGWVVMWNVLTWVEHKLAVLVGSICDCSLDLLPLKRF